MEYHEAIQFRADAETKIYDEFFHSLLTGYGKPKSQTVDKIVRTMIAFFINSFLTMTCLSGYNETNVNRLLVNYTPTACRKTNRDICYLVVKGFKNLYWSESHLVNWDSFPILMSILKCEAPTRLISMGDIVLSVIFLNATGVLKINPMYFVGLLDGDPFYVRRIVTHYWFQRGLCFREIREFKFAEDDLLERRKNDYMKRCLRKPWKNIS